MRSVKTEKKVLDNLSSHYAPFGLLSRERLSEVVNVVRFIELRKDEILQLRGETVRATSDCKPLVRHRDDFDEKIRHALIKTVHPNVAQTMMETGCRPLEARYAAESDDHHIPGSLLMPLYELRNRMDELDKNERYIVSWRAQCGRNLHTGADPV